MLQRSLTVAHCIVIGNFSIEHIPNKFSKCNGVSNMQGLWLFYFLFVFQFWMAAICNTLPIPAGVFVPVFTIGRVLVFI